MMPACWAGRRWSMWSIGAAVACGDGATSSRSGATPPIQESPDAAPNPAPAAPIHQPSWATPRSYLEQWAPRHSVESGRIVRTDDGAARFEPRFTSTAPAVMLRLPLTLNEAVSVSAPNGQMTITFALAGAAGEEPIVEGDSMVFVGALGARGSVALRASAGGVEDFVELTASPPESRLSYVVQLSGVAGLRLTTAALEYLDGSGTPQLRTRRPWLVDRAGVRRWAQLSIEGCRYDSSPVPPWRRPPTPPGSERCSVHVDWDSEGLEYPVLIDPEWTETGELVSARLFHTATLLENGQILIVGGQDSSGQPVASTEIYDETTRTFSPAGDLEVPRLFHSATLLVDSDSVLVAGGYDADKMPTRAVERFRDDGTWGSENPMPEARAEHAATALAEGRVVITGGGGLASLTFELDDLGGSWSTGHLATVPRYGHTASLSSGRILVVGGNNGPWRSGSGLTSVESLEVGASGEWRYELPTRAPYFGHTATVLPSENVLVVDESSTALFDAYRHEWRETGGQPALRRRYHIAVLLPSAEPGFERVVIAGGIAGPHAAQSSEYFLASQEVWSPSPLQLGAGRYGHAATVLRDGTSVLVTGGNARVGGAALAQVELAQFFAAGTACATDRDCFSDTCIDGRCCERPCDGDCESCGASGRCEPLAAGFRCGEARGSCGSAPVCDGQSSHCPDSIPLPPGTVCLEATEACVADAVCDGEAFVCQAPILRADGDACDDGDPATVDDSCATGKCIGKIPQREVPRLEGLKTPFSCAIDVAPRSRLSWWWAFPPLAVVLRRARRWRMYMGIAGACVGGYALPGCGDDDVIFPSGGTGGLANGGTGGRGGTVGAADAGIALPDAGLCEAGVAANWSAHTGERPPARSRGAAAGTRSGVVLFGGADFFAGLLADTWEFGAQGWKQASPAPSPSPRVGHAMSAADAEGSILLFGGEGGQLLDDTWLWREGQWQPLCDAERVCEGPLPGPRFGHAMALDSERNRVVLTGGFDGQKALEDTWTWSASTGWLRVCAECSASDVDCCGYGPRFNHGMVYDPASGSMLVFGGNDGQADLDSLSRLSGVRWRDVEPRPIGPGKRSGHSMVFDAESRAALVLGGLANGATLDDGLWAFDLALTGWARVRGMEPRPAPRAFAPLVSQAGGEFFLLGGGATGERDDTWGLRVGPSWWPCGDGGTGGTSSELDGGVTSPEPDSGAPDSGVSDAGTAGGAGGGSGEPDDPCAALRSCCPSFMGEDLGRCYAVSESTNPALCRSMLGECP